MTDTAPRVRLIGVRLQLDVVTDDGTNLTMLPVQPVSIPAAEWAAFDLGALLGELQRRVTSEAASGALPAPPPTPETAATAD
jgi:hypothetical protein